MSVSRLVVTAAACLSFGVAVGGHQLLTVVGDLPGRSAAPPPKGTGLVMGRAVDADSGAPIPDATVTLSSSALAASWEAVVTDAQGRFVIRDLPKATLRFNAVKPGYVPGAYTKRLPIGFDEPGQTLGLGDDERVGDITIKMWKYAVIEGAVTDESGDPVVDIVVRALPRRVVAGRAMFAMETSAIPYALYTAQTDDRGVYRLSSLPPGDYVVAVPVIVISAAKSGRVPAGPAVDGASSSSSGLMSWLGGGRSGGITAPQIEGGDDLFGIADSRGPVSVGAPGIAGFTPDGHLLVYETQFFPGTAALSRATPVSLGSGATRSSVDFRLRPTPAFKIAGTASRPDGPAGGLTMRLVSAEMSATSSDPEVAITTTDTSGRFVFLGVTAGPYAIRALDVPRPVRSTAPSTASAVQAGGGGSALIISAGSNAIPDAPTLWAETPVAVGDRDVANVVVTLRAGVRISGRVEFEGSAERPDLASRPPPVTIARADGQRTPNLQVQYGRIDPSGGFATYGQQPGQYIVQVTPPPNWNLAGVFLGARDVSVLPLDVSAKDIDGLVIKFTDKATASIAGTVTDGGGQPAETASVIVFPIDRQLWSNTGPSPRNLRAVGTGRGGRYSAESLPPGDYFVAAVPELKVTWADPKALETLVSGAFRVTVREFEATTVSVRLGQSRTDRDEVPIAHGPFVDDEPQTVRDAVPPAVAATGRISGVVVVDGQAPAPAARAHVTLQGVAAFGSRTIITTANGRFDFGLLPAGRYSLFANKSSYINANYGQKTPGGQGTAILLADGQQLPDLRLSLQKGSVITGTIRDERGVPMPGIAINAHQYRAGPNGERRLSSAGFPNAVRTDDRGSYRMYGLAPGEYYLSATPPYTASNAHQTSSADIQFAQQAIQRGGASAARSGPGTTASSAVAAATERHATGRYATVLYPGVTSTDGAQAITLGAGDERSGIDFSVRFVPTVRVEGTVSSATGPLPSNVDLRLLSVGAEMPSGAITNIDSLLPMRLGADGRFTFTGVAPGAYVVAAMTQSAPARAGRGADPGPETSGLWGLTSVDANGVDLSNIAVLLQPGMKVSGKVRFNAATLTPPADPGTVRLSLSPVLTTGQVAMGQTQVSPGPDGTFTFAGLTPGNYNLRATLAGGWLMTAVSAGGRDVLDGPFELKPGDTLSDASVVLSDRPAEVSGVLQSASGRPASDYYVILMPADSAKWKSPNRRMVPTKASSDGRFTFRNLLPGEWLIGATTDYEPGTALDPAFLAEIAKVAVKVTVAEGEKKVQDIKVGKS